MSEQPSSDQRLRFVKLRVMGSNASAIMRPNEVADFCDGEEYITEDVWMTEAEYEALPEFEGY